MSPKSKFISSLSGGFLNSENLKALVNIDRFCLVLVRCNGGRFLAPAQHVAHFIAIIERDNRDYVRDVSVNPEEIDKARKEKEKEQQREREEEARKSRLVHVHFREEDLGGVFDGNQVTSDADPGL